MQFVTRPLEKWPRPVTRKRVHGGYSVPYNRTLNQLERELHHLKVRGDVVIQIDMPEAGIRRDGTPYAGQTPRTPRVGIAFTSEHGPMTYYCDAHHDWRENVRAICLGLERLRLVARTGIVSRGEQYTGFRALPAAIEMPPAMTVEEAAKVLGLYARTRDWGEPAIKSGEVFTEYYRAAAKLHHPDAGGRTEDWAELQKAADVLKRHHKLA